MMTGSERRLLWARYDAGDAAAVATVHSALECGVVAAAAALLGVPVRTLWYRIRRTPIMHQALLAGRAMAGLDDRGYRRGGTDLARS